MILPDLWPVLWAILHDSWTLPGWGYVALAGAGAVVGALVGVLL